MRPLSAAQLLDAWEKGLSEPTCTRSLPLLAAASPDFSPDALAMLSIGERDRRLLTLRVWTFGSEVAAVTRCSTCGEALEWTVDAASLSMTDQAISSGELTVETEGYCVRFRLPNTKDLAAATGCQDAASARLRLLQNCISGASFEGEDISPSALPDAVTKDIGKQMAAADPQAQLEVDLSCPACGEGWQALFDIESFFWSEVSAWAQRVLSEVHVLARAYGWSETQVLSLSPWRRQVYLGLVGV
jgi:hypothetical protein